VSLKRRPGRTWCYAQKPAAFDYPPCRCGNSDLEWSEKQKHVWCAVCRKDFIPAYQGILDGPIPMGLVGMMGIRFDRVNLKTMRLECFDVEEMAYYSPTPQFCATGSTGVEVDAGNVAQMDRGL